MAVLTIGGKSVMKKKSDCHSSSQSNASTSNDVPNVELLALLRKSHCKHSWNRPSEKQLASGYTPQEVAILRTWWYCEKCGMVLKD